MYAVILLINELKEIVAYIIDARQECEKEDE